MKPIKNKPGKSTGGSKYQRKHGQHIKTQNDFVSQNWYGFGGSYKPDWYPQYVAQFAQGGGAGMPSYIGGIVNLGQGIGNAIAPKDAYGYRNVDDTNLVASDLFNPSETAMSAVAQAKKGNYGRAFVEGAVPGLGEIWANQDAKVLSDQASMKRKAGEYMAQSNNPYEPTDSFGAYGGYMPMYCNGGKWAWGGKPNSEIEDDEVVQTPDGQQPQAYDGGSLQQTSDDTYTANGQTHDNGGIGTQLPNNSKIFSDRIKHPQTKQTYAKMAHGITLKKGRAEKILKDPKATTIAKRTAQFTHQKAEKDLTGLFNHQEGFKHSKLHMGMQKLHQHHSKSMQALHMKYGGYQDNSSLTGQESNLSQFALGGNKLGDGKKRGPSDYNQVDMNEFAFGGKRPNLIHNPGVQQNVGPKQDPRAMAQQGMDPQMMAQLMGGQGASQQGQPMSPQMMQQGPPQQGQPMQNQGPVGPGQAPSGGQDEQMFQQMMQDEARKKHASGGIHIKKSHEGRFTEWKKRTGKTTEEALHSKNPHVRQMANFARNAKKWKHDDGGMQGQPMQPQAMQQGQQQGGQGQQAQQMVQQISQAIQQGQDPKKILQQLVQSGIPQDQAMQIIQAASQGGQQPQGQPQMADGGIVGNGFPNTSKVLGVPQPGYKLSGGMWGSVPYKFGGRVPTGETHMRYPDAQYGYGGFVPVYAGVSPDGIGMPGTTGMGQSQGWNTGFPQGYFGQAPANNIGMPAQQGFNSPLTGFNSNLPDDYQTSYSPVSSNNQAPNAGFADNSPIQMPPQQRFPIGDSFGQQPGTGWGGNNPLGLSPNGQFNVTGNKSQTQQTNTDNGNNWGKAGYALAAYAPTIFNSLMATQKPYQFDPSRYMNTGYDKYNNQSVNPALNQINSSFRTGQRNIAGRTNNNGTYLSNLEQLHSNAMNAGSNAIQRNQMMNQQGQERANRYNTQLDSQNKRMLYGIDTANLQQRAVPEQFAAKAATGMSDIAQMNKKMDYMQQNDQTRMSTLKYMYPNYDITLDADGNITMKLKTK